MRENAYSLPPGRLRARTGLRLSALFACLLFAGFAYARTERVTIQGDHGRLVADLQMPAMCMNG